MVSGERDLQMALEEEIIEDDEVTEMLLRMERIGELQKPHKAKLKPLVDELKAKKITLTEKFPLERTQGKRIRVGPFVIEGKTNEDTEVNFVRSATYRASYKRLDTQG